MSRASAPLATPHNARITHSIGAHPRNNARQARPIEPRHHTRFALNIPSGTRADARAGQTLYVRLLWAVFPAPSANAVAAKAAPVLGKTERQVMNHLDGTSDGKAADLAKLILLAGVEKLAQMIEGTPAQ